MCVREPVRDCKQWQPKKIMQLDTFILGMILVFEAHHFIMITVQYSQLTGSEACEKQHAQCATQSRSLSLSVFFVCGCSPKLDLEFVKY